MRSEYVQYGCGWCAPDEWFNFDASPTLRFERLPAVGLLYTKNAQRFPANVHYGDIVQGLPIADDSCKAIYCSHVLEHLALDDLRVALRNSHRILRQEGVFRLVVPDLESSIRHYVDNPAPDAAIDFLKTTLLGRERRSRGLRGLITNHFGNNEHLWMWDYKSLAGELQRAGFSRVRRARFGDNDDPMFRQVEQQDRWEDCLGIECTK